MSHFYKIENLLIGKYSAESVGKIISTKNHEISALYKKHKKIPKEIKSLI